MKYKLLKDKYRILISHCSRQIQRKGNYCTRFVLLLRINLFSTKSETVGNTRSVNTVLFLKVSNKSNRNFWLNTFSKKQQTLPGICIFPELRK